MSKSYSVSVARGKVTQDHAQRKYTPESADRSLSARNVVIRTTPDHKAAFNEFFRSSIEDYNSRQKRKDRRKSLDYWSECESSDGPEMAWAVQIGNRKTLGVLKPEAYAKGIDKQWREARANGKDFDLSPWLNTSVDRAALLQTLERIGRKLPEKFPNFEFTTIVLHDDEPCGTPHLDVIGFPHATGYSQSGKAAGVQTRCSLTRALGDMGYKDLQEFGDAFRDYVAEEMAADGYSRQIVGCHEARLPVDRFRDLKARESRFEAHIRHETQKVDKIRRDSVTATREAVEAKETLDAAVDEIDDALDELDAARDDFREAFRVITEDGDAVRREFLQAVRVEYNGELMPGAAAFQRWRQDQEAAAERQAEAARAKAAKAKTRYAGDLYTAAADIESGHDVADTGLSF